MHVENDCIHQLMYCGKLPTWHARSCLCHACCAHTTLMLRRPIVYCKERWILPSITGYAASLMHKRESAAVPSRQNNGTMYPSWSQHNASNQHTKKTNLLFTQYLVHKRLSCACITPQCMQIMRLQLLMAAQWQCCTPSPVALAIMPAIKIDQNAATAVLIGDPLHTIEHETTTTLASTLCSLQ